jgi:hypothetical protein
LQVARQFGDMDSVTVWKIAKAEGITLAAKGGRPRQRKPGKIVAALKANPNALQVARHAGGVSSSAVWEIAKEDGIELAIKRPSYCRSNV